MTEEINNIIGPGMYFGFVEAFHLEIVLACIIHIAQRDKINTMKSASSYIAVALIVIISLLLVGMYVFMAYTVERLSKSYRRHVVLDIRHMKDERYRIWLEDKQPRGNIFQRHFSLICLLRDIFNTIVLYTLYYRGAALVVLITVVQIAMLVGSLACPPYIDSWKNRLLRVNQMLYLMLDVVFIVNVVGGDNISPNGRYYFIGFIMISIVMVIIALNVAIPLYYSIKELIQKCKKRKRSKVEAEKAKNNEKCEVEAVDRSSVMIFSNARELDKEPNEIIRSVGYNNDESLETPIKPIQTTLNQNSNRNNINKQIYGRKLKTQNLEKVASI